MGLSFRGLTHWASSKSNAVSVLIRVQLPSGVPVYLRKPSMPEL